MPPNPTAPGDELQVKWSKEPAQHDYPAAASYLSLVAPHDEVDDLVSRLQAAPVTTHKAKDILRASGLRLLPMDDQHVLDDLRKIDQGVALSPVLLVRGQIVHGVPAQIADGYHRVCASYHLAENTDIPARIVDLKEPVGP
ncbi:MAG: hypothetical protein HQ526_02070 [Actinobacteria bacterium]|nr:hypothetical protein [Actinomycetota bacterium]